MVAFVLLWNVWCSRMPRLLTATGRTRDGTEEGERENVGEECWCWLEEVEKKKGTPPPAAVACVEAGVGWGGIFFSLFAGVSNILFLCFACLLSLLTPNYWWCFI